MEQSGCMMGSDSASTVSAEGPSKVESQMYNQLRKLINVVDELRDCGVQQWIQLPRICVLGTQSAGKSSVLEAIVGFDFLPRGDGVVTRRPLELRLVHLPEAEHGADEAYAIFDAFKERKFTNFAEVRAQIERLTDEVAGKNKGIVDSPIVLTVYASHCPDLSLIDLPGITRVPLKGSDQSDDIETLTRQMALRYASDPRTIILAVLPANADMSTSDALQLARRVDPRGVRTIGVITKIDLMDRGTDAAKMLTGEEIPLRLGYTGIRNRSQADIKAGKSIACCLEEEKKYFKSHPVYGQMSQHFFGVPALTDKLTRVLFLHIKHFLPEIKKEIQVKSRAVSDRIHELGEGVPMESRERAQLLWSAIADYVEVIKCTIKGTYDKRFQKYFDQDQCLTIGSWIRNEYTSLLEDFCERQISDDITDTQVENAIRLHEGESLPGFPSPDTFEHLILPHLKKLAPPVMECIDRVAQTLDSLSQRVATRVFCRFPALADRVLEISQELLARERDATRDRLQDYIDAETGYLFTNDARYLEEHGTMITQQQLTLEQLQQQQLLQQQQQQFGLGADGRPLQVPSHTERAQQMLQQIQSSVGNLWVSKEKKKSIYGEQFIQEIRRRLDAYFNLVLRNVRDTVQDKLQFELYNKLNDEHQFTSLLGEPSHIVEERRALMSQLDTLKKAAAVLQRDPQITALNYDRVDGMFETDLRELQRGSASNGGIERGSAGPVNAAQDAPKVVQQPENLNVGKTSQQQQHNEQLQQKPLQQQPNMDLFTGGAPPTSEETPRGKGRHLFERSVMFQPSSNPLFND